HPRHSVTPTGHPTPVLDRLEAFPRPEADEPMVVACVPKESSPPSTLHVVTSPFCELNPCSDEIVRSTGLHVPDAVRVRNGPRSSSPLRSRARPTPGRRSPSFLRRCYDVQASSSTRSVGTSKSSRSTT